MINIRKKELNFIAVIYSILLFLFLLSSFFPYDTSFYTEGRPHAFSGLYEGFGLPFQGYYGIILILLSITQLTKLHLLRAIVYGGIGCISITLNFLYYLTDPMQVRYPQSYVYTSYYNFGFMMFIGFIIVLFTLIILFTFRESFGSEVNIRKTILNLGTKYDRLEVREIAERSKMDRANVIVVAKKMIDNQEIYATYFSSSKTIAFDQQANINEIDRLMETYKKWEEDKSKKS